MFSEYSLKPVPRVHVQTCPLLVIDLVSKAITLMWRKLISFKPETDTGNGHSLERRLYYNADVGRPSFKQQKEVNIQYVLVAAQEM
jgi:hypothetical protein